MYHTMSGALCPFDSYKFQDNSMRQALALFLHPYFLTDKKTEEIVLSFENTCDPHTLCSISQGANVY